jgi:hypothetical protein
MKTSAIEILLDQVNFVPTNGEPNEKGLPYVTHEGILKLGEISITVYQLSSGQRIIPEDELKRVFGQNFGQNIKL